MVLKNIRFIVLVFPILAACGNSGSNNMDKYKTDAAPGKTTYQKYCTACHGKSGDLGLSGAPNLRTSQLSLEERITVISNGRGNMPSYGGNLNVDEIREVAEYTMSIP